MIDDSARKLGDRLASDSNWLCRFHICIMNSKSLVYYNIFSVTETLLSHHMLENEILPFGYTIYSKDRDSCGGSVLLAVNKKFTTSLMSSPTDIKVITTRFHKPSLFIICVTYIPPNSSEAYYNVLFNYSSDLIENSAPSHIDRWLQFSRYLLGYSSWLFLNLQQFLWTVVSTEFHTTNWPSLLILIVIPLIWSSQTVRS